MSGNIGDGRLKSRNFIVDGRENFHEDIFIGGGMRMERIIEELNKK